MVAELPPPPAPIIERLEASFSPYEHLWAGEGEAFPAVAPARRRHGEEPEDPVRLAFSESAIANPIDLLLDRLGSSLRTLCRQIRDNRALRMPAAGSDGLGDGSDPVPAGDPIPVDGGGKPTGG